MDKAPGQFSNRQKKRPPGSRKCSACAAATGGRATAQAAHAGGADPEAPRPSNADGAAERADVDGPQAPAAVSSAARVCAWSGCGRALSTDAVEQLKCSRCKQAFYCGRTCQKRHWGRGGHKDVCAEPPCCTICLDGGDEPVPVQRGCACRGDAGLAHVACLAQVAARKAGGVHEGWWECPTCGQNYTGAMELGLTRVLVHRMRTRPRSDYDRLCAEANLGNALRTAGQFAEAADVLARVFATKKRVVGEESATALRTANSLATTYRQQGRLAEAEELQVWVAEASGRVNGKEHPDTLNADGNLAGTYSMQGKYADAEELQVDLLEATRRVHGKEHPHTLSAAANLARTYDKQGKHAEAEELQARTLAVGRRVLGAEHPNTLVTAANLAFTYNRLGRLTEAEELLVEVLPVSRRVRGVAHPSTLDAARSLTWTYNKQGRDADAGELRALYHL